MNKFTRELSPRTNGAPDQKSAEINPMINLEEVALSREIDYVQRAFKRFKVDRSQLGLQFPSADNNLLLRKRWELMGLKNRQKGIVRNTEEHVRFSEMEPYESMKKAISLSMKVGDEFEVPMTLDKFPENPKLPPPQCPPDCPSCRSCSIVKIPSEVLIAIASYLHPRDVYNIALLCKAVSSRVHPVFNVCKLVTPKVAFRCALASGHLDKAVDIAFSEWKDNDVVIMARLSEVVIQGTTPTGTWNPTTGSSWSAFILTT
jgi:hypothetical protein